MAQSRCTSRQTSTAKLIMPPCVDSFLNIASMANGQKWSISHALQCGSAQVRYISSRRLFK